MKKLLNISFASSGHRRLRRAGLTGITSVLAKGLTVVISFISVPLTVNYLGQERYGVWITMSSLLTWLVISDVGFNNALVNLLAQSCGEDHKVLAKEFVATAFWALLGIGLCLLIVSVVAFKLVPWDVVFNISNTPISELHLAIILSLGCFISTFPLSIVTGVYRGYQQGFIADIWGMVGNIFSLVALFIVTRFEGGLPQLVIAQFGVRSFVLVVNAVYLFIYQYPWLSPSPAFATWHSFRRLITLGSKYLLAQLAGIGTSQSQPMIITQLLGPTQVGIFSISQKLMMIPMLLVQMFNYPLMPAYSEAQVRKDWHWIWRVFRLTLISAVLITILMVLPLILFAKPVINLWVGAGMLPERGLLVSLGVYAVVNGIITPMSVMLYGLECVGGQAILAMMTALFVLVLGIVLTNIYGITGMGIAMALGYIFGNLIGQIIQVYSIKNSQD